MHHVADPGFEACITSCGGGLNGRDTSTHDRMVFGFGGVAEERRDGDGVHGELVLEVSEDLHGFWVEDFGAIVAAI